MELLAERPIEDIGYATLAERAGISLSELRGEFGSLTAILAAYVKSVDEKVLSGEMTDMAEEPARERLFDILMRRIEALSPHKEAIGSLARSASLDPALAIALNSLSVRSQRWMLTAAGIDASGSRGALRAQGLAVLFAGVIRTWLRDDDPGLARTMAALDRALRRGGRLAGLLDFAFRLAPRPRSRSYPRRPSAAEDGMAI